MKINDCPWFESKRSQTSFSGICTLPGGETREVAKEDLADFFDCYMDGGSWATSPQGFWGDDPRQETSDGSFHYCQSGSRKFSIIPKTESIGRFSLSLDTNTNWTKNQEITVGLYSFESEISTPETQRRIKVKDYKPTDIALGSSKTCVLLNTKDVKCWGHSLVEKSNEDSVIDIVLSGGSYLGDQNGSLEIKEISAYHETYCVITTENTDDESDDTVRCWGEGSHGELGNGETSDQETPVIVVTSSTDSSPLTGVKSIKTGQNHTCALLTDGTARCWGQGAQGQLGNNLTNNSSTPVEVIGKTIPTSQGNVIVTLDNIVEISSGNHHSCALVSPPSDPGNASSQDDEGVWCWGRRDEGQLSRSIDVSNSRAGKIGASLISEAIHISSGENRSCATLYNAGKDIIMKCWGEDIYWGDYATEPTNRSEALEIYDLRTGSQDSLFDISQASLGSDFICALHGHSDSDSKKGQVSCWGKGSLGRLGQTHNDDRKNPVFVLHDNNQNGTIESTEYLTNVRKISVGKDHACALLDPDQDDDTSNSDRYDDNKIKCWGKSNDNRLGSIANHFVDLGKYLEVIK